MYFPLSSSRTSLICRNQVLCLSWVTDILGFLVITWLCTVRMALLSKSIQATWNETGIPLCHKQDLRSRIDYHKIAIPIETSLTSRDSFVEIWYNPCCYWRYPTKKWKIFLIISNILNTNWEILYKIILYLKDKNVEK